MPNIIEIFDNIVADATSEPFKITVPDSIGSNDTDFSAYFEIFGGLGGGTLTLEKKCVDGIYRNLAEESTEIAGLFPPTSSDVLVMAINYKDPEELFRFKLTGATASTLSIYGINMNRS